MFLYAYICEFCSGMQLYCMGTAWSLSVLLLRFILQDQSNAYFSANNPHCWSRSLLCTLSDAPSESGCLQSAAQEAAWFPGSVGALGTVAFDPLGGFFPSHGWDLSTQALTRTLHGTPRVRSSSLWVALSLTFCPSSSSHLGHPRLISVPSPLVGKTAGLRLALSSSPLSVNSAWTSRGLITFVSHL